MISANLLHAPRPMVFSSDAVSYRAECEREFAAAERELEAFVSAVRILFGEAEAAGAAELWVQFAENIETPLIDGRQNWRRSITVAAASQLATKQLIARASSDYKGRHL